MRKRLLILFSFLLLTAVSVAFSDYIIVNLKINDLTSEVNVESGENKNDYKKVTFFDPNGNELDKRYFKNDDLLTYDELPSAYQGAKYEWVDQNGNSIFSLKNSSFTNGVKINKELTLQAKDITTSGTTTPSETNFTFGEDNKGDSVVSTNKGRVVINENDNKGSVIEMKEPILNNVDFDINFQTVDKNNNTSKDNQSIVQELGGYGNTQHSKDRTIGLEDPNSLVSIYKPKANNSSLNSNPLVTRLKLTCDTYLFGTDANHQSWLGVGARTGFFGGSGWSQFSYQGLINGSYCELDLNGHKLYIGNYATLELRGSLIDSSLNKTGEVIVEKGGTLKSTFVIEDHYHETSIPIGYAYGDAPYKMYRMPYLNVKLRLNKGSTLIGYLRLDFGGDEDYFLGIPIENKNYTEKDLNILGNSNEYMINTSSCPDDSYVIREPYWDEYWSPEATKDSTNSETETVQSIVYQKFNYYFYNCLNLEFNTPTINKIEYSGIVTFSIIWDRCDYFIPPYFNIYLYNSTVKIKNNIIFFPGSYLYIDKSSKVIISANSFDISELVNTNVGIPDLLKIDATYQAVGGLMFLNEKPYWKGSWTGRTNDNSQDSQPPEIFDDTTKFWSYVSKNYPAKADIYGEISFDNNVNLVKENYHLGGQINFYNTNNFININNEKVELYNSIFIGTACHFDGSSDVYFNADAFIALPLISRGNVLTDMSTCRLRQNYSTTTYTFDKTTGLITTNTGVNYGYTYYDNNGAYNNRSNSLNKAQYDNYNENDYRNDEDDLRIRFYQATKNQDNTVSMNVPMSSGDSNAYTFIYFRGCFFRYQNGAVDIFKFKGPNPGSNSNGWNSSYTASVVFKDVNSYYGHNAWMIA